MSLLTRSVLMVSLYVWCGVCQAGPLYQMVSGLSAVWDIFIPSFKLDSVTH